MSKPITVEQIGELIALAKTGKVDRAVLQAIIEKPDKIVQFLAKLEQEKFRPEDQITNSDIYSSPPLRMNVSDQYEFWCTFLAIKNKHQPETQDNQKLLKLLEVASRVSSSPADFWLVIPKPSLLGGYWQAWEFMEKTAQQKRSDFDADSALSHRGIKIVPRYALQIMELERQFPGDFLILTVNLGMSHLHKSCRLAISLFHPDELILGPYELTAIMALWPEYVPGAMDKQLNRLNNLIMPIISAAGKENKALMYCLQLEAEQSKVKLRFIPDSLAIEGAGLASCFAINIQDYTLHL